ncbi:MAG: glycosyltransferase family 9 protein, partial [Acidobacteriota bacterium]
MRLGALGDVIHAVPAQQQLSRRFPSAAIHWLTEPPYREILQAVPGIDRVWVADTKGWRERPRRLVELIRLVRALRRERFDLAFDFQGLLKSAGLARLAGTGAIYGFQAERFKERAASWLCSHTIDGEADLGCHTVDTNLRLASLLTGSNGGSPLIPLSVPEQADRAVCQRLAEAGLDPQSEANRPALINPGAGWATKIWPARDYARLGSEIEQRLGIPVVYTYGPGEEVLIRQVRQTLEPASARAFPTSILELAALCRRSRLMVGGDTGPIHLAAALGVPIVAVLGPTTASRNGPFDVR